MPRSDTPRRSPLAAWAIIAIGLIASLAAIRGSEQLASAVPVTSLAMGNAVFYGLLFGPLIVLALVLGAVERRAVLRAGRKPLRWAAIGLALGAGGLATCVLYASLHGTLTNSDNPAVPPGFIALNVAIALFGVAAEEMLFRGWLLPSLDDRVGATLAVVLSALAFSAFHLWAGGATDPVSLANLMLGGLWFALLAQRSGGLIAPIAAHFGWNVTEDIGFGLVPNPGVGELGALSNHDLTGSLLWGGGEEGFNSSIAMTLVLVALLIPLLPALSGRASPRTA